MPIDPEDLAALTSKATPIGIEDLSCLTNYTITPSGDNVVHAIRFEDGGWADITFRPDGTAFLNTDGMLSKRFVDGGTLLCALSDADVTGP